MQNDEQSEYYTESELGAKMGSTFYQWCIDWELDPESCVDNPTIKSNFLNGTDPYDIEPEKKRTQDRLILKMGKKFYLWCIDWGYDPQSASDSIHMIGMFTSEEDPQYYDPNYHDPLEYQCLDIGEEIHKLSKEH